MFAPSSLAARTSAKLPRGRRGKTHDTVAARLFTGHEGNPRGGGYGWIRGLENAHTAAPRKSGEVGGESRVNPPVVVSEVGTVDADDYDLAARRQRLGPGLNSCWEFIPAILTRGRRFSRGVFPGAARSGDAVT